MIERAGGGFIEGISGGVRAFFLVFGAERRRAPIAEGRRDREVGAVGAGVSGRGSLSSRCVRLR